MAEYPICDCEEGADCPHYGIILIGRLYELAKMDNQLGDKYRRAWTRSKGINPLSNIDIKKPRLSVKAGSCGCKGKGKES